LATRPTLAATIRVYGTTQRWCRSRRHPYRHPYIVRAPRGRTRGRQWPQKAVAVQLPYPAVGGLFGPLTFAPALACLARPVHADKYIRPVARLERAGRDEQTGRARRERTGWTWNPTGRGAPVATPWWVRAGPSALRVTSSGVVVSCILLGIPAVALVLPSPSPRPSAQRARLSHIFSPSFSTPPPPRALPAPASPSTDTI
jgi:hypothetical protein